MPRTPSEKRISVFIPSHRWKIFGVNGSLEGAKKRVQMENSHGASLSYEFKIVKTYVGKSVDPAYSDKNGYQYIIWYRLARK